MLLIGAWVSAAPWALWADESRDDDEETLKTAKVDLSDEGLLSFFRHRTVADEDREKMKLWITQLGADDFDVREKASAALVARGSPAEPFLKQALKSSDIEVVRRAEDCLKQIKRSMGASAPAAAARLLARKKPAGAVEVLLAYLPFADNDGVAEEVRNALAALALRDNKIDPALTKALGDKDPIRRSAAGEALCRAGAADARPAIKKLLHDSDAAVRLRIALALAAAKDKEAFPVLIDLLGELSPDQAWPAEDVLLGLARDQAPSAALGSDKAGKKACRQAWTTWWQEQGSKIDLTKHGGTGLILGYTLILLLDTGEALEVDSKGHERWHFKGLQKPLDIQYLQGNRVLVAEHDANRVTERNLKGEIVWEKRIEAPLAAQRLPNGNTFIATANQLLEVDHGGREAFSYQFPGGDVIMKAQKLRNGDLACVVVGPRFVRLDSTFKELYSFPVQVRTSGGRIDVLPSGRVVVPEKDDNRIAEYDARGKVVWETEVTQPIAAVRLLSGNTLVTSMTENRAAEIDRSGKTVWEYKSEYKVNRAFRR
jgi:HEAT repeat protein